MPNYLRPGVFVEETLLPLTQPFSAPGASIGAFVGTHNAGPTVPTLVTSWSQFNALYGGFGDGLSYLPFAVFQYFNNGGRQAYIVRAVGSDAVASTVTLMDRAGTPASLLTLTSRAAGAFGNQIYFDVVDSVTGSGRFDLLVKRGGTTSAYIVERYADVSMNPADQRYLIGLVNSPAGGSPLISAARVPTGAYAVAQTPALQTSTPMTGGSDGVAVPNLVTAAQSLDYIEDNLVLNLPGVSTSATINSLLAWSDPKGNIFVVIDAPAASATVAATVTAYTTLLAAYSPLSSAAFYGPWLLADDPAGTSPGAIRPLPPGGAVMGVYATTDATRGVQKPPAGIATPLIGVLGMEVRFANADLDTLNPLGGNIIRSVPGAGWCIMGARTLKPGQPDRYISIRRTLQYIKKALMDGTRFAIFEPNNPDLWDHLRAVIGQFLTTSMQIGVLKGNSQSEAYYVKVDEENNPPVAVANGEVHIEVGVALNSPAEFVVIKIGQFEGGTTAIDSTSTA